MHSPWSTLLDNLENWKKDDKEYSFGEEDWEPTEIMLEIRDRLAESRDPSKNAQLPDICKDIREAIWEQELSERILDNYSQQDFENEWLDQLLVFTEREGDYDTADEQFARWYSQNGNWRGYRGASTGLAQGWKIHVSAEPESGREILEVVQPYLLDQNISHKARDSVKTVQNKLDDGQPDRARKFFTIYPEPDEDMLVEGEQTFELGQTEMNRRSMRANQEKTEEVMKDLYNLLAENNLLDGENIEGRNNSEVQVGDTILHFRYGSITSGVEPTVIGGREQVVDEDSIFDPTIRGLDKNGEQISSYTPPDEISGIDYIETPEGIYHFN